MAVRTLLMPRLSANRRGRFCWAGYFATTYWVADPPDPEFSHDLRIFAGFAWTERGAIRKARREMERRRA